MRNNRLPLRTSETVRDQDVAAPSCSDILQMKEEEEDKEEATVRCKQSLKKLESVLSEPGSVITAARTTVVFCLA